MLRIWEAPDRLENIFLELLDDPSKKELLLYPICYCQMVRRFGDYEVDLPKLVKCAEKPYSFSGGHWQDHLLELGIFYVKDGTGKVYKGKELLTLTEEEGLKVGISQELREDFYRLYSRLLKYWSVLSSRNSYGKPDSPEDALRLLVSTFNERLYKEARFYGELCASRFTEDKDFFNAVKLLSDFYYTYEKTGELKEDAVKKALSLLKVLPDRYRSVNLLKLKRELEKLLKEVKKGNSFTVKIEFWKDKRKESLLRRLFNFLKKKLRRGEDFFFTFREDPFTP